MTKEAIEQRLKNIAHSIKNHEYIVATFSNPKTVNNSMEELKKLYVEQIELQNKLIELESGR